MNRGEVTLAPMRGTGPELDEIGMVAARAFHHDPFFEYLDPNPVRRSRALALFFRSAVEYALPQAQITAARMVDGHLGGVAVWIPPGAYPLPAVAQVRQLLGGFRAMVLRPRALTDGVRYLLSMERAHPKDPLWYLLLLVVDPLVQRSGVGSQLQQGAMAQADGDGLDCYLETQNPDNIAYYGRFGYEVVRELRPVPKGPPLFTMRRPCAGSS